MKITEEVIQQLRFVKQDNEYVLGALHYAPRFYLGLENGLWYFKSDDGDVNKVSNVKDLIAFAYHEGYDFGKASLQKTFRNLLDIK